MPNSAVMLGFFSTKFDSDKPILDRSPLYCR